MPNVLSPTKQKLILSCLVEGMSINSTSRITGCHKVTILRLLCDVGTWASTYCDEALRNLSCKRLELDEAWSFVYVKEANKARATNASAQAGDVWTWVAFDPDTKLVPSWLIGDRTTHTALAFVSMTYGDAWRTACRLLRTATKPMSRRSIWSLGRTLTTPCSRRSI